MRWLGLALGLCGCSLLSQKEVLCSDSNRCDGVPDGGAGGPQISAPFVLGQPDERSNFWSAGLSSPSAVGLTADGKLFVADRGHDRILIWTSFPTRSQQPANLVLGQAELSIGPRAGQPFDRRSDLPDVYRLTVDGTQLFAASEAKNTLFAFRSLPTTNNPAYSFFTEGGTGISASTFSGPSPGLAAGRLYLADRANSRVMVWNPAPTTGGSNANGVLGQINLQQGTVNSGGLDPSALNLADGSPSSDGTKLLVSDTANHRALLWSTLPAMKNDAPSIVLGQASFTANSANRGGAPDLGTLSSPIGGALSSNRLAIVDRGNHRVLLWNQHPTVLGQAADLVLGHTTASDVQANSGGVSGSSLSAPSGVATDGTRLVVADSGNHRVLIWPTWPTASGAAASLVLGQPQLTSATARGLYVQRGLFASPSGLAQLGSRLVVSDSDANRVLIFDRLPLDASAQASLVLGQPSFDTLTANSGGLGASSLSAPRAVASDGTALAIADSGNHRVLIYRSPPSQNQAAADLVLGQSSLTGGTANAGGANIGLSAPGGVALAGGRLYVADTGNHRVLIWNSLPTQNGQPADIVLGQADLSSTMANRGLPNARGNGLKSPSSVYSDGTSLYVSDSGNSRVLIWNTPSPASGAAADLVLGQGSLTGGNPPAGATPTTLLLPQGIGSGGGQLYVADAGFHRVLRFSPLPSRSTAAAIGALGQSSLTASGANSGGISLSSLNTPGAVLVTATGLYIADTGNSRLLCLPPL